LYLVPFRGSPSHEDFLSTTLPLAGFFRDVSPPRRGLVRPWPHRQFSPAHLPSYFPLLVVFFSFFLIHCPLLRRIQNAFPQTRLFRPPQTLPGSCYSRFVVFLRLRREVPNFSPPSSPDFAPIPQRKSFRATPHSQDALRALLVRPCRVFVPLELQSLFSTLLVRSFVDPNSATPLIDMSLLLLPPRFLFSSGPTS